MSTVVLYHSLTGHTLKLARHIAGDLSLDAVPIGCREITDNSDIILCTPVHNGDLPVAVPVVMKRVNLRGKRIIPFFTYAGWAGRTYVSLLCLCDGAAVLEPVAVRFFKSGGHEPYSEVDRSVRMIRNKLLI